MEHSVVTGIVVQHPDGRILLVKKQPGQGPYEGTYLTPGGGVSPGEPIDEAVQRELYEETGVRVKDLKRVAFDDAVTKNWEGKVTHYIMLLYTGVYVSGDLQPTENDDDNLEVIQWFSSEQLKELPLSLPLEKLLQQLKY